MSTPHLGGMLNATPSHPVRDTSRSAALGSLAHMPTPQTGQQPSSHREGAIQSAALVVGTAAWMGGVNFTREQHAEYQLKFTMALLSEVRIQSEAGQGRGAAVGNSHAKRVPAVRADEKDAD